MDTEQQEISSQDGAAASETAREKLPDPEDWVKCLGWDTTDPDGERWVHPIAPMSKLVELLDQYTDDYDVVCELIKTQKLPDDDATAERMVAYAREALKTAHCLVDELEQACDYLDAGDVKGCVEMLEQASRTENEYGDDPSTQLMADMIFRAWAEPGKKSLINLVLKAVDEGGEYDYDDRMAATEKVVELIQEVVTCGKLFDLSERAQEAAEAYAALPEYGDAPTEHEAKNEWYRAMKAIEDYLDNAKVSNLL